MKSFTTQPIFFERNRVYRIYEGGFLFSDFFGDPPIDNNYPEEWVASTVQALNGGDNPKEGLSFIKGTNITLKELFDEFPEEMVGTKKSFHLLVKLLDSSIRLPLQVHPDSSFSQKYFNSKLGKTEMWLILATRENAGIHFGFKDKMTPEHFKQLIAASETDKEALSSCLNYIPVKPGEIYLVPSKMVHAIGKGCLILEIQEPTDFTIQPEYWCGDYKLNEKEMYLGLTQEEALGCFNYSIYGKDSIHISKKVPTIITERNGMKKESLMTYQDTPCFAANRYTIHNSTFTLTTAPAIYIVTNGSGSIIGNSYKKDIAKGDYFFLPYASKDTFSISTNEMLQLVECLPAL